jgi:DNA-binding transcriptional regulator YiaG
MNVNEARNKAGLSQRKLALAVGVSLVTIQNWDAGIGKPSPDNLKKLEEVVGKITFDK